MESLPTYILPDNVITMMEGQKITNRGETPNHLLQRVTDTMFAAEERFNTSPKTITLLKQEFAQHMVDGRFIPGTPTLTNAGRRTEAALSSCVVIPTDLRDPLQSAETIRSYYAQNMGSGFDFTQYDNPVELVLWLNQLAADETATGAYDRYIGNMGSLHISHPRIKEFIALKSQDGIIPYFNISVDIPEDFMQAVIEDAPFQLADGTTISASDLFTIIAQKAWQTGDPGILFMDRMNQDNPIAVTSPYLTTPPCGEMGLSEGETCQFGYLNLHSFTDESGTVDYKSLGQATSLITRALDNAIEYSLENYPTELTTQVAQLKRKIGIGVCGLAEMFMQSSLPYGSEEARLYARDVLAFINYISKKTSVDLASVRGSCGAMNDRISNTYFHGYLERKYALHPTHTVTTDMWTSLASAIKTTGHLRNIATTALPPTGRASIILGVTSAIEPFFSVVDSSGTILPHIAKYVRQQVPDIAERVLADAATFGSFQNIDYLPKKLRSVLKTAQEIDPYDHIAMVGALAGTQGVIDEAASKTVNLPQTATVEDVRNIFVQAWQMGLKNIAVYRDKSKMGQPQHL